MYRTCSQCEKTKPIGEFGKLKSGRNGIHPHCKECVRNRSREYKKLNREKVYEYNKKYRKTHPEVEKAAQKKYRQSHADQVREYNKQWEKTNPEKRAAKDERNRLRYPEKVKAHDAVYYAVRSGKLPPVKTLKCSHCKIKPARHYHHHKGYAKEHRLDVEPLCNICHTATHAITHPGSAHRL